MLSKNPSEHALLQLAAIIVKIGRAAVSAKDGLEKARKRYDRFCADNLVSITSWRVKRASYLGFLVKSAATFMADYFLLHPILTAIALRMFGASIVGMIASMVTPLIFIIAESIVAVKYERARELEAQFGVEHHAKRWLYLGYFIASIPALIVVLLGLLSTTYIAALGLVAVASRQALNIILAVITFTMHILLVHSGTTPRDFTDWLIMSYGRLRRRVARERADRVFSKHHDLLIETATRYDHVRLDEERVTGPSTPFLFPETILALIHAELPTFGQPTALRVAPVPKKRGRKARVLLLNP